jgi:glycerol-3-phosphate dehydrogenase
MRRDPDALLGQAFDLVVVGAGITGAGVALDAALRGLRVALLDKGDFASGTSSLSSKLVHGGLRYLEHGQLGLVYEALHERRRLLHNAPHLVRPLRFLIPFYAGARVPAWQWRAGLALYDVLAGRGNLPLSRGRTRAWLRGRHPGLAAEGLRGGGEYSDAQMDDARLCLEVVRTAAEHGAAVCNYAEVTGFETAGGQLTGVRVVDRLGGREGLVRAGVVVNACGPWSDAVRRLAGEDPGPLLAPTKGVHLVAPGRGLSAGFLLLHPRDGRVFFVLPWLGKTLIGTTDTDCDEPPDELSVTAADVDYLLEGHNRFFRTALGRADVLGSFAGLRPLARSRPGEPSARSREWRLAAGPTGLLSVVGGKYTTYRHMAEKITDEVMRRLGRRRPCRTRAFRLDGAPEGSWPDYGAGAVAWVCRQYGLSDAVARHLVGRYGRRVGEVAAHVARDPALAGPVVAGEPDLLAELAYQREQEMACRPEDFLLRRTRLGLFRPGLLSRPPALLAAGVASRGH